jgi:hypothetical protein
MTGDLGCRIDSWILNGGSAWFECHRGTIGCPRIHDGFTPHCIACAAGTCEYGHEPPALEMTETAYREMDEARR